MACSTLFRPVLALILLGLAGEVGHAQSPEPEPIPAGRAPTPGAYQNHLDVLHYDLELALDSGSERFLARARIRVCLRDAVPDEAVFDFTGLAAHRVAVDGRDAPFHLAEGRIRGGEFGTTFGRTSPRHPHLVTMCVHWTMVRPESGHSSATSHVG